jgi:5-methylcytosine-specific restriction enzyme A
VPDKHGNLRTGFIFALVPFDDTGGGDLSAPPASGPIGSLWTIPLIELKQQASRRPDAHSSAREARKKVYAHSEAFRVYVQRRADGRCEGCHASAPFRTKKLRAYLEPHHTARLCDGGPDHPAPRHRAMPNLSPPRFG